MTSDERHMKEAVRLAREAAEAGEVPVGALVVRDGRVIARARNQMEQLRDATAHAEMLAITAASAAIGDWRLDGCALYATLEPCPMCAGAVLQSRVPRIVYAADDPRLGACGTKFDLLREPTLPHSIEIVRGVLREECEVLMKGFFAGLRKGPTDS